MKIQRRVMRRQTFTEYMNISQENLDEALEALGYEYFSYENQDAVWDYLSTEITDVESNDIWDNCDDVYTYGLKED